MGDFTLGNFWLCIAWIVSLIMISFNLYTVYSADISQTWIWVVIGVMIFTYFVMMVIVTLAPLGKLTCLKDDDIT